MAFSGPSKENNDEALSVFETSRKSCRQVLQCGAGADLGA